MSSTEPLPAPSDEAHIAGGYDVHRHGLEFEITKDGKPITPDPYLGARGHLVALREGDLAYLHVHAEEDELRTHRGNGRRLERLDRDTRPAAL